MSTLIGLKPASKRSAQPMSASDQKQTCAAQKVMSALTPKADMCGALAYVCFVPIADIHSISMVVSASMLGGIVRPSAFAVFTLIAKLNIVDINTGSSAGFSPLRMRAV
jgi:hypothetical protein